MAADDDVAATDDVAAAEVEPAGAETAWLEQPATARSATVPAQSAPAANRVLASGTPLTLGDYSRLVNAGRPRSGRSESTPHLRVVR